MNQATKKTFATVFLYALTALCLPLPQHSFAQTKNSIDKSAFWGNSDKYLNNQAFKMFELIDRALAENPPATGTPMLRKLALYNLDAMLHDTRYDNSEPLDQFISSRMNRVIDDLANPVKDGMKVYKIYNEGFIARTPSATMAFDLARGRCQGKTLIPDSVIQQIADHCDILFLSHNHDDHVDPYVVEMFLKAGKPVVAPTDILPEKDGILHKRPAGMTHKESIELPNHSNITIRIFPGNQDLLMNNIYVVTTPENKTFAHVGDQYNKDDMEWIVNISRHIPRPDVLVVNCWTHRMNDLINGFNPKLVVTGHENEMGHTIDHREAFWLTFEKMEKISTDSMVIGWGEWFTSK